MYKPLAGIRVLDFTTAGAGPSCTKLLTEYGAEDILIEPLAGNSSRGLFKEDFYNTGKRSLTLNVKTEKGMAIMLRLIEQADVFVSNYRTRALERLGLTWERLHALNPRLVYAVLTGFGDEGPDANHPGYDPIAFWARGGLLRDIAERGSMTVPPVAVGDIATGQALAGGICAALYQREKTGLGDKVMISLLAEAAYLNHDALVQIQYGDKYPQTRKAPRRSLLNTYRCADGEWLVIAVFDFERYWAKLLTAVDRADLIGDPRWQCIEDTTNENSSGVVALLDEAFGRLTRSEALARLQAADIPCEPVVGTEELLTDPQCRENRILFEIDAVDGKHLTIPANPIKFTDRDSGVTDFKNGPLLGADSCEILRELGCGEEEIRQLIEEGITSDGRA